LKSLGFGGTEIGVLMALAPVSRFLFPVFWGLWADRTGKRRLFVILSQIAGAGVFSLLFALHDFARMAGVMFLYGFLLVPAVPLVEGIVQEAAEKRGFDYGRLRLWGSIGYIAATLVFGRILDVAPARAVLAGILGISVLAVFPAFALPGESPPGPPPSRGSLGRELWRRRVIAFFAVTALMQASHGAYYAYYSIYLDRLGYSRSLIGGFWILAVVAEVVMMLASRPLLVRLKAPPLLALCLAAAVVRWLILAASAAVPLLLLAQLLHAFTFGLFHVAAVGHTHRLFPPALRSSGQSLYSSLTYGLGNLAGLFGAAALVERIGFHGLFGASSAVAFLGLLLSRSLVREEAR
jgi:PPP family 3-phenylpropionic acid transporter